MPTKEQVRRWLEERSKERRPPPDPKQIRRELGWTLNEVERAQRERSAIYREMSMGADGA
jgi:hypothetical protein